MHKGCSTEVLHSSTLFIAGNPHADTSAFIHDLQPIIRALDIDWMALSDESSGGNFNVPALQEKLSQPTNIVLHFPLYWYSPPALVKHWLDSILTPGWAFPSTTSRLRGKSLILSITTGAPLDSFQPDGANGATLEALLLPLKRTALYCGMNWGGIVASQWNSSDSENAALSTTTKRHSDDLVARITAQG